MDGLILLIGVIYLLPAAVAQVRRHHQTTAIVGLNLLLGWTFIGWAVALVWALTATPPPAWVPAAPAQTVPVVPTADPPWLDAARGWALIIAALLVLGLLVVGLARGAAAEAGTSCTTRWDAGLQRYLTRCSDGRQFKSTYDKGFDRYRTRELPPWKKVEAKGSRR
jgi:Superinfection immunity protein